jgi:hypothetical protein
LQQKSSPFFVLGARGFLSTLELMLMALFSVLRRHLIIIIIERTRERSSSSARSSRNKFANVFFVATTTTTTSLSDEMRCLGMSK